MNATVNILCFKSKTLANGEHPLMICICKNSKRKKSNGLGGLYWHFKKRYCLTDYFLM